MNNSKRKPTYPDTLFGNLGKLPYRTKYHQQRVFGIHHWDNVESHYAGDNVDLVIMVNSHSHVPVLKVDLIYTLNDWSGREEVEFEEADLPWDTITWGWIRTLKVS